MVTITCYGGVNEIGGNKVFLRDGDTCLLFDFGTSFGRRYLFFEEYLKPCPGVGLLDLLKMELLPPLEGIYRQDLVPNDDLWPSLRDSPLYRELSLDGVLLSHAYIDHSGYISFPGHRHPHLRHGHDRLHRQGHAGQRSVGLREGSVLCQPTGIERKGATGRKILSIAPLCLP